MDTCISCGSEGGDYRETRPFSRTFGERTFDAEVPALICRVCDDWIVNAGVVDDADEQIGRAIAAAGVVLGKEVKLLRKVAKLSPEELGAALDVPPYVIVGWEAEAGSMSESTRATLTKIFSRVLAGEAKVKIPSNCAGKLRNICASKTVICFNDRMVSI